MIHILLFSYLQEWHEQSSFEIPYIQGETVEELKNRLQQQYKLPNLQAVMIARNEQYALPHDVICEQDVIALIPPVSGG